MQVQYATCDSQVKSHVFGETFPVEMINIPYIWANEISIYSMYVYLAPEPELRTFGAIPLKHNLGWPRLRSLYNLPKYMLIHFSKNAYFDTQFSKQYNRL